MFGLKSKPVETKAILTPDPTVVATSPARPEKITARPEAIPDFDKYVALANQLKTGSALRGNVLRRQVADFLWERGIEMYSYSDVNAYLKARTRGEKVKIENTGEVVSVYRWRPLRDSDGQDGWGWQHDLKEGGYFWKKRWECRTYDKVVPFDVLENVKALETRFPKKLHFFVSDIEADPDPFIIANARDMSHIVFGAWDEPEFFRDPKQPR